MSKISFKKIGNGIMKGAKAYACKGRYYLTHKEYVEKGAMVLEEGVWHDIISDRHYELTKDFPAPQFVKNVVQFLKMQARKECTPHKVHRRIGEFKGELVYDLGGGKYAVLGGKKPMIKKSSTAPFSRCDLFMSQPEPDFSDKKKGWKLLRELLNVSDEDFILVQYWLVSAFLQEGERPVLLVNGPQGSGKSSMMKMLKMLLDPYEGWEVPGLPKNEEDLFVAASKHSILMFDNISKFSKGMSDAVCRIATGGGITKRKLYSDSDEYSIAVKSLIAMNGISDFASAGDLLDRAVVVTCESISELNRKTKVDMLADFEEAKPAILGAILWAAHYGYKNYDESNSDLPIRMADAVAFSAAWYDKIYEDKETLMEMLESNQEKVATLPLEADIFASYFIKFIENKKNGAGMPKGCMTIYHHLCQKKVEESTFQRLLTSLGKELHYLSLVLRL